MAALERLRAIRGQYEQAIADAIDHLNGIHALEPVPVRVRSEVRR